MQSWLKKSGIIISLARSSSTVDSERLRQRLIEFWECLVRQQEERQSDADGQHLELRYHP